MANFFLILEILSVKCQMQKLGDFIQKNNLVSNDSELSNSARNGKKNSTVFGGSGGTAAVSSVFRVDQFNSENILKN